MCSATLEQTKTKLSEANVQIDELKAQLQNQVEVTLII